MTGRTDPGHLEDGVRLAREVLEALPPEDRRNGAIRATVEGMLAAAELLEEDDIGMMDP